MLLMEIERSYDNMDKVNSKERFTVEGRKETMDEKISNIFINVGIPPHIKGYSYLREGVKIAVDNPDVINNITKKLYPMIGEKYETTASKVERAIRHAIEVAWNRGRIETINSLLGIRAYVGNEKPTNGEFIALIADKMLLERA
jgi:two-component system response regulator (stage 0 sporulation protein A)